MGEKGCNERRDVGKEGIIDIEWKSSVARGEMGEIGSGEICECEEGGERISRVCHCTCK